MPWHPFDYIIPKEFAEPSIQPAECPALKPAGKVKNRVYVQYNCPTHGEYTVELPDNIHRELHPCPLCDGAHGKLTGDACDHGTPKTKRCEQCVNEGRYTYAVPTGDTPEYCADCRKVPRKRASEAIVVQLCPLHKGAQQLRDALVAAQTQWWRIADCKDSDCESCTANRQIKQRIDAALALTKGDEPQ